MSAAHYTYLCNSLLTDRSKNNINHLIEYVGNDKSRIKEMMDLIDDDDKIIRQRGSWVIGNYAQKYPGHLQGFLYKIIKFLNQDHDLYDQTVLRNLLKVLEYHDVNEEDEGLFYAKCIDIITDLEMEIAPRAFSITVALKIALKYPELMEEFKEILEIIKPDQSAAIQARIKKSLTLMKKKSLSF